MSDRDLAHLCPELLLVYNDWVEKCTIAGLKVEAIVTWRSAEDQDAAKANGLSNAGADQSPHNCVDAGGRPASRAFDYGIFEEDGSYIRDGQDPRYRLAGSIGKELGLAWGGDWHHPDWDHLELANWKTMS